MDTGKHESFPTWNMFLHILWASEVSWGGFITGKSYEIKKKICYVELLEGTIQEGAYFNYECLHGSITLLQDVISQAKRNLKGSLSFHTITPSTCFLFRSTPGHSVSRSPWRQIKSSFLSGVLGGAFPNNKMDRDRAYLYESIKYSELFDSKYLYMFS